MAIRLTDLLGNLLELLRSDIVKDSAIQPPPAIFLTECISDVDSAVLPFTCWAKEFHGVVFLGNRVVQTNFNCSIVYYGDSAFY